MFVESGTLGFGAIPIVRPAADRVRAARSEGRQTNRWPFGGGRTKAIVCGYGDAVTLISAG